MIKGRYESHLPVSDLQLSIKFYQSPDLKLYKQYSIVAFLWIKEGKSWLGLWQGPEAEIPCHPSLR